MEKHSVYSNVKISSWAIFGISFVLVLMFFLVAPEIDRTICYKHLSDDLGIPLSSSAIRNAIYKDLISKTRIGFTYDQTLATLDVNWRYKIIWRSLDLGGGFKEYMLLDHCYFSKNDFSFLFVYSKDGNLTNILNYIDD